MKDINKIDKFNEEQKEKIEIHKVINTRGDIVITASKQQWTRYDPEPGTSVGQAAGQLPGNVKPYKHRWEQIRKDVLAIPNIWKLNNKILKPSQIKKMKTCKIS